MESRSVSFLLKRLKELRVRHDLTQEGFAEISGISYKYYQALEAGRKRELRISTLERLAKAYGIEVWELLCPHDPVTRLAEKSKPPVRPHYKTAKQKKTK